MDTPAPTPTAALSKDKARDNGSASAGVRTEGVFLLAVSGLA